MYALNNASSPVELAVVDLDTWQVADGTPADFDLDVDRTVGANLRVTPDESLYVYGPSNASSPAGVVARLNPQPPFKVEATWAATDLYPTAAIGSADGRVIGGAS